MSNFHGCYWADQASCEEWRYRKRLHFTKRGDYKVLIKVFGYAHSCGHTNFVGERTMENLVRKLSLPFIAGALFFNSPVKANNLNFTLENDTGEAIIGVWVSTRSDQYWEPLSPFYDISAGASTYVSWPNGGPCWQQLQIKFDDGRFASWSEPFDLCTVGRIKIKYNANSNRYSANSYNQ